MLNGKKILLGVCGSIAAYKAAILVRNLVKQGCEVQVIMTQAAKAFISPLTLATLSKNPVLSPFYDEQDGTWKSHVELGLWADALLIAPASANTMARFAHGICDNLLSAVYLSARCPVYLAPAMDLDMYQHPATKDNMDVLQSYGNKLIPAGYGELASGLTGEGRMAEPEEIVAFLRNVFSQNKPLKGKTVLVTAGPTHEHIDPVRFIGNHSSGKMGFALAETFAVAGAAVTLVAGPTALVTNDPNIHVINVVSAAEMYKAVEAYFPNRDISVFAAAVADFTPKNSLDKKVKKDTPLDQVALEKTKDIAFDMGQKKRQGQFTVGFALETDNELENAYNKLKKKQFDLIVMNSLNDQGAGFHHETNKITILDEANMPKTFDLKSKKDAANDIVQEVISKLV